MMITDFLVIAKDIREIHINNWREREIFISINIQYSAYIDIAFEINNNQDNIMILYFKELESINKNFNITKNNKIIIKDLINNKILYDRNSYENYNKDHYYNLKTNEEYYTNPVIKIRFNNSEIDAVFNFLFSFISSTNENDNVLLIQVENIDK